MKDKWFDVKSIVMLTVGVLIFGLAIGFFIVGVVEKFGEQYEEIDEIESSNNIIANGTNYFFIIRSCDEIKSKIYILMDKIESHGEVIIKSRFSQEVLAWKVLYDVERCKP